MCASDAARPQEPSIRGSGVRGPGVRLALGLLWLYRRTLSPALVFLGVRCRHYPTCSDYSAEAFRRHGLWRGGWLTLARLSRCHPFGSSGWDPVPERIADHRLTPWRYGDWSWRERPAEDNAAPDRNR